VGEFIQTLLYALSSLVASIIGLSIIRCLYQSMKEDQASNKAVDQSDTITLVILTLLLSLVTILTFIYQTGKAIALGVQ